MALVASEGLLLGCGAHTSSRRESTLYDLCLLGQVGVRYSSDKLSGFGTLSEFVRAARTSGYLERKAEEIEKDHWGKPYKYDMQKNGDNVEIRITSGGGGPGDEMTCVIRVTADGAKSWEVTDKGVTVQKYPR
jgi:hypothetical protein